MQPVTYLVVNHPFNQLDTYDVIWDSPSKDASGSMPLGNGDLGLNVWVEPNGDLLALIGKTDAWDENSTLLKLGRLRISISPNPFGEGMRFRQTLQLQTATIDIVAGSVWFRIWVDANHPIARFKIESQSEISVTASIECWRNEPRQIKTQTSDMFRDLGGKDPFPTIVSPDQLIECGASKIIWCHHNAPRENDAFEINMRLQGLGDLVGQMPNPLLNRTFGGMLNGDGFEKTGQWSLRSTASSKHHELQLIALTEHPSSIIAWQSSIEALAELGPKSTRDGHEEWWNEFWNRSWVYITSDVNDAERTATFHITQSYVLQRFMNAAGGRGAQPIKHNGSIFSVGKPEDPDFRRWGGPGFWFQNQRLIYWPMLASGDFDLIAPWVNLYVDSLPTQTFRTQKYFGHGGAHYPETITFWGAEVSAHYGWTPFEKRERPEAECRWLTYHWNGGIELTLFLLDLYEYTGDEAIARDALFPIADAVLEFFAKHYPRDSDGKLHIEPSQALETWHVATNSTPDIAGLQYTIDRLLALPETKLSRERCERWKALRAELPPIPRGMKDDKEIILPAQTFDVKKNTENPELYCVFPYRVFGIDKPDLDVAINTFNARLIKTHECWSQDEIQMALLGLTDEAADYLKRRAAPANHSDSRFPAFWNAFHDWIPDIDHGGALQLALQLMLLQCEGSQIKIAPAFPKNWIADFKLLGPNQRVIAGRVIDGKFIER